MQLRWSEETARRVRASDPSLTELDLKCESTTFPMCSARLRALPAWLALANSKHSDADANERRGEAGNKIGEAGARAVAEALKTNRSLTTLNLSREHGGGHAGKDGGGWERGGG